mgnify:CR=1 FL=1
MAKHGGKRENAGRKPIAEEEKANTVFINALKSIHDKEQDDEAKLEFIKDLYESQRGQIFIAEHLFGKAPDTVNQNTKHEGINFNDLIEYVKTK